MSPPRLKVVLTRRLPDAVETRARELFDAELNLTDKAMDRAALEAAVQRADVLVPTITDIIDGRLISQGRRPAEDDRQFRRRGGPYRHRRRRGARGHRHQHPRRPDRGHGRPDHGPDPRRQPPHRRGGPGGGGRRVRGLDPDLDDGPQTVGQAAGDRRHGPDRTGAGAAGQGVRDAGPLSQPQTGPGHDRRGAGGDILGRSGPDAGADGPDLAELPGDEGHPPSAVGRTAGPAAAARRC